MAQIVTVAVYQHRTRELVQVQTQTSTKDFIKCLAPLDDAELAEKHRRMDLYRKRASQNLPLFE